MDWLQIIRSQEMGIALLTITAFLIYGIKKKKLKESSLLGSILGLSLVFGLILLSIKLFIIASSLVVISLGFYDFSRLFLCKTKVTATYKGYKVTEGSWRGLHSECPIFSFTYDEKDYLVTSTDSHGFGEIRNVYIKNNQYDIHIYNKNPKRILLKKSNVLDGGFLIFTGVVLCISLTVF